MEHMPKELQEMSLGEIVDEMINIETVIHRAHNPDVFGELSEKSKQTYYRFGSKYKALKSELDRREKEYKK